MSGPWLEYPVSFQLLAAALEARDRGDWVTYVRLAEASKQADEQEWAAAAEQTRGRVRERDD